MTKTILIGRLATDLESFVSHVSITGGMRAGKSTLRRQLLELLVACEIEKCSKHELIEWGMSLDNDYHLEVIHDDMSQTMEGILSRNLSVREMNKETEKQALFHKGVKRGKYLNSNKRKMK